MGLMTEYMKKSAADLEIELLKLISEYNEIRNTYLVLYATAIGKLIPDVALNQEDYYTIVDILREKDLSKIDFYIESLGGSGESAEEIVRFMRSKFDTISFVVPGQAKSAGTIIVLSGDEILMTETGSLGPIDAQVKIGRSIQSAYDYIEWTENKQKEAKEKGALNPFDAIMIAQISPGELSGVLHSLNFAKDLVIDWLSNYKFKKWQVSETKKIPITEEIRRKRAEEIANDLIDHSKWRSHGRSIKIDDLRGIGLKITRIEDNPDLSKIVYRIQTVCRFLFTTTTAYKIFATEKEKIFKKAILATSAVHKIPFQKAPNVAEITQKCPKCGKNYKIYGKFVSDPKIDIDFEKKDFMSFPKDNELVCSCGFTIDLAGIRNQIEMQAGRKLIV